MSQVLPKDVPQTLRRWKSYPSYKDSGVEWLGEIPEHWEVRRNKTLFNLFNGYAFKGEYFSKDAEDAPILVTPGNFLPEGGLYFTAENSTYYISDYPPEFQLLPGDQLIVMTDLSYKKLILGQCVTVDREGLLLNQRVAKIIISNAAKEKIYPLFLSYLLNASCVREQLISTARGATVFHSSPDKIGECLITLPLLAEQQAIASFLDRETAKIDALIAKKEQLIEFLQEKRTAIISHAVTKGLDPTASLKDSGVDWLGKIPAHWEVKRLMYLTLDHRPIMYGIILPGSNVEDGVPIIKGGDVTPERLRLDSLHRTTWEIEAKHTRSRLQRGDIVYAIRGSIGMAEIVPPEIEGANLTQDAARIAPKADVDNRWLLFTLKSKAIFAQLDAGAIGATIRGINIRDLKRAILAVPPVDEQHAIASYLDRETAKIDALIAKICEGIKKLKEYRTALISAAVTGKIDVRNEVAS